MSNEQHPAWGTGVQDPNSGLRNDLRLVCEAIKRQGVNLETARIRREAVRLAHEGGLSAHDLMTVTGMSAVSIHRILEGSN